MTRQGPPLVAVDFVRQTRWPAWRIITIGIDGEVFEQVPVARSASPEQCTVADTVHQPIVVTYEGGARFAAQIRSHRVVVDQPERAGGADSGPMPLELLGTALGTCIAYYVQQFLHARDLPYQGMRVEVEQHKASNPNRVGVFAARVILPAPLPVACDEPLERVVRSCPAHGTLTHAAHVLVTIEHEAGAAA